MANKFAWTRELEDALRKANMPEEKIVAFREMEIRPDVEKLSFASLDGVSGGAQQTVNMNGCEVSRQEFDNMFLAMAESFDFFTAINIFKVYCGGFVCDEMLPGYTHNSLHRSDKELMGVVLYHYWLWRETGYPYAHP